MPRNCTRDIPVLPNNNLANNLADQQCIGYPRTDGGGVFLGILRFEEDIGHRPEEETCQRKSEKLRAVLTSGCFGIHR